MKNRVCYVLLLVLVCYSCSENSPDDTNLISFPDPTALEGEKIVNNYYQFSTIQHYDSLVIGTENRDNFIHVFNEQGEHITSIGRKGKGPGEFLRTPRLTGIFQQDSTIYSVVYNEVSKKATTIDLGTSLSENKVTVLDNPPIPTKLETSPLYYYFYLGDSTYVSMFDDRLTNQFDGRRNAFYYNSANDSLNIFKLKNLELEPYEMYPEVNLNNRFMRVSPDRSKFAFVMMYYPMVEIFETGSEKPDQYLIESDPSEGPYVLADYENNELDRYFFGLYTTNKYLYLLGAHEDNDTEQFIYVMDWNGNAVDKFLIPDEYNLDYIAVDEENKDIYGISYSQGGMVRFNYSNLD